MSKTVYTQDAPRKWALFCHVLPACLAMDADDRDGAASAEDALDVVDFAIEAFDARYGIRLLPQPELTKEEVPSDNQDQ